MYREFIFVIAAFAFQPLGCSPDKHLQPEGFIDVTGGKVWYHIYGDAGNMPVLVLHGGPGASCYSLEPLQQLSDQWQVIFTTNWDVAIRTGSPTLH